ncbi:MAG: hypothetical protein BVN34_08445 [Proteobacteria bacterium ST_bin12]|nr:MAG: hypothetical protein BVN34_08445 [Proteobacteria bacterium ST_bin12]
MSKYKISSGLASFKQPISGLTFDALITSRQMVSLLFNGLSFVTTDNVTFVDVAATLKALIGARYTPYLITKTSRLLRRQYLISIRVFNAV